jgi:hypothetical protein
MAVVVTVLPTLTRASGTSVVLNDHNTFIDVLSYSSGTGYFSYSITNSSINPDFGFYLTASSGRISIQSYGVLEVESPPGWEATVNNSGLVTWRRSDSQGWWIHDTPVTFSLRSSITETTVYSQQDWLPNSSVYEYPMGLITGPFTQFGNPNNGGLGTDRFSFLGPVVPEPSTVVLFAVGLSFLLQRLRSEKRVDWGSTSDSV